MFLKMARMHVLNSKLPRNKSYKRLMYYKMIANYNGEFDDVHENQKSKKKIRKRKGKHFKGHRKPRN